MADEKKPESRFSIWDALLKPVAVTGTSLGTLHLFGFTSDDEQASGKWPDELGPEDAVRRIATMVASKSLPGDDKKRPPMLSTQEAESLTQEDLEAIATAYLASADMAFHAKKAAEDEVPITRSDSESSVSFLSRLAKWRAGYRHRQHQRMLKGFLKSTNFEALEKAAFGLSRDLRLGFPKYLDLSVTKHLPLAPSRSPVVDDVHQLLLAQQEHLSVARGSASLLAKQSETLSSFLGEFSVAKASNDRTTKIAMGIAVASLLVTTWLAYLSYDIAKSSFQQDKTNNAANDKWQDKVLETMERQGADRASIDRLTTENDRLRSRIDELETDRNKILSQLKADEKRRKDVAPK